LGGTVPHVMALLAEDFVFLKYFRWLYRIATGHISYLSTF
jgi:hypothetical protein